MNNYSWLIKSLGKKVDANKVVSTLKSLNDKYGKLTPAIIVSEAENKKSVLHNLFEWDDSKAAYNYRLQQARVILNNIEVKIIKDGEEKYISNYEIVNYGEGNIYKTVDVLNVDDIEFIKNDIIRQLNSLKNKLNLYKEFKKAVAFIDKAIDEL